MNCKTKAREPDTWLSPRSIGISGRVRVSQGKGKGGLLKKVPQKTVAKECFDIFTVKTGIPKIAKYGFESSNDTREELRNKYVIGYNCIGY